MSLPEGLDRPLREIGGKFSGLAKADSVLSAYGLAYVPSAVCWTASASIEWFGHPAWHNALAAWERGERQMMLTLISRQPISWSLESILRELVGEQHDEGWAIRSSGALEDDPRHSFAGQFESIVGTVGVRNVTAALRKVIASVFSESAELYRVHHGLPLSAGPIPVIIQRMVDAKVSGVFLSVDPHGRNNYYIESIVGLGGPLVSGEVIPSCIRVRPRTYEVQEVQKREQCFSSYLRGGRVAYHDLAPISEQLPTIGATEARRICRVGETLGRVMGSRLDIEWSIDSEGHLAILQVRKV